jgi:hypothetical protein
MNHENKDRDARDVNEDRTGHEAEASAACNDDDITLPYYVASNLNGFTSHHIDEYGGVGEIGNIPRNKSPFGKHHAKHMVSGLRHEYLRHRHLHEWRRSEEETHSDEEALLVGVIEILAHTTNPKHCR